MTAPTSGKAGSSMTDDCRSGRADTVRLRCVNTNIHELLRELSGPRPLRRVVDITFNRAHGIAAPQPFHPNSHVSELQIREGLRPYLLRRHYPLVLPRCSIAQPRRFTRCGSSQILWSKSWHPSRKAIDSHRLTGDY